MYGGAWTLGRFLGRQDVSSFGLGPFFDVLNLGGYYFSEIKMSHIVRSDLTRFQGDFLCSILSTRDT